MIQVSYLVGSRGGGEGVCVARQGVMYMSWCCALNYNACASTVAAGSLSEACLLIKP